LQSATDSQLQAHILCVYEDLGDAHALVKVCKSVFAGTSIGLLKDSPRTVKSHCTESPAALKVQQQRCSPTDKQTKDSAGKVQSQLTMSPAALKVHQQRCSPTDKQRNMTTSGIRWLWCKPWKGPLPPPRKSLPMTLGDMLRPAMQTAGVWGGDTASDPELAARDSKSNPNGPRQSVGSFSRGGPNPSHVRCEMLLEDGFEDLNGVENHLQRIRDAGDGEVAFFEDRWSLMLAGNAHRGGWMAAGVSV
jgi:hypothetical protein